MKNLKKTYLLQIVVNSEDKKSIIKSLDNICNSKFII